jgi:hypothetical protein
MMTTTRRWTRAVSVTWGALCAPLVALACAGEPAPETTRQGGTAVVADSSIPRAEALARFRAGLAPATDLAGPGSADSLVAAFVSAVSARDTAVLNQLVLDRAEFAWVFYPSTPQGLPPYDLSPQLMWDMLVRQSDRGLTDALTRLGGRELGLVDYDCGSEPAIEADNRVWGPCTITLTTGSDTLGTRLTGPILEHGGRYKFISFTNDLD